MFKLSYEMIAVCSPSQGPYEHFSHSGKTTSMGTEKTGRVCMHVKERERERERE